MAFVADQEISRLMVMAVLGALGGLGMCWRHPIVRGPNSQEAINMKHISRWVIPKIDGLSKSSEDQTVTVWMPVTAVGPLTGGN